LQPRPTLSVIIPAFNEAARLPATLRQVLEFFGRPGGPASFEVVVVDDASQDRTSEVVKKCDCPRGRLRLVRNGRNRGKGASVRRGMAAARGERLLFTDADLSTPITEYSRLAAALDAGADIAIGSRAVPGAKVLTPQPVYRTCMGKTFNLFVQLISVPGIHDSQCGFKLFTRQAARRLFRRLTVLRFGFDVEILFLARKARLRVAEIPVTWRNSLPSKVSPLKDAFIMFLDLFRIRCRHISFKIK